ncbi:hypothetical protein ACFL5F_00840 [Planctomycetota bacterium]
MRSKKLAVRYGLLTVLLVSLSLASTSSAWTFYRPRVEMPEYDWYVTWRGTVVFSISCDTPGSTTHITWACSTNPDDAPIPTDSSPIYRGPYHVIGDIVIKARAYKDGWTSSDINTLIFDFWPHSD